MRSASKTGARKSLGGGGKKANLEIEIKLRIPDRRQLFRQLARLEAKLTGARVHEMNTLYDTTDGNLSRHGRMLRVRVERPAGRLDSAGKVLKVRRSGSSGASALLTYKGPGASGHGGKKASKPPRYKIREERELGIADHEEMSRILEALGFRPWFRYEKFRSTYRLPGMPGMPEMKELKLEIDETPIGLFVELEGPRGEIDRAAGALGFARAEYINKSYGALFVEERGVARRAAAISGKGSERESEKGPGSDKRLENGSHNEPGPFSGLPDMLFRRTK